MKKNSLFIGIFSIALLTSCDNYAVKLNEDIVSPTRNMQKTAGAPTYTLVFQDDFNSLDTANWTIYDGPGNSNNGLRKPAQFSINNGILYCTAKMINGVLNSGGMGSKLMQTYGRFEARVLCQSDPSGVMSGVILTWPQSENWPIDGENDFYETGTNVRTPTSGWETYIHYSANNYTSHYHHQGNSGTWHTVAMDWTPSEIRLYDEEVLVWSDTNPDHIPHMPHKLCIQYDAFGTSISEPSSLLVDWVRIYTISEPTGVSDNTTSYFTYSGGTWINSVNSNDFGGSDSEFSYGPGGILYGGTMIYTFSGTRAKLYSYCGPWSGIADMYVDGVWKCAIDQYRSTDLYQQMVFDTGTLPAGNHYIKMYALGTKNASSKGYGVGCDYAEYY